MFKRICFIFCITFFQQSLWAEDNEELLSLQRATGMAITTLSTKMDINSIVGWEAHHMVSEDEVLVRIFFNNGIVEEMHCGGRCTSVGQSFDSSAQSRSSGTTVGFILGGEQNALGKWVETLVLRPADAALLEELESYKVWLYEDTSHGHGAGINVWTKIVYHNLTVFIMCHPHGTGPANYCHYRKSGMGELGVAAVTDEEHEEHHHEHDHGHEGHGH